MNSIEKLEKENQELTKKINTFTMEKNLPMKTA